MRRNVLLLALAAAVLLNSCIEYKEKVSLNKDGSGTVDIHFAMSAEYLKQMDDLMKMTAKFSGEEAGKIEQPNMISTRTEIEEFLAQSKSNVKLLEYSAPDSTYDGTVDAKFSFSSLAELDIASASLFPDDNPAAEMEGPSASFAKQDDGTWLFTRAMHSGSEMVESMAGEEGISDMLDGGLSEGDDEGASGESDVDLKLDDFVGTDLEALARDMEKAANDEENPAIEFTISFPGKVLTSNATVIDGSKATWSFTLEQISKSISAMTATIAD